MSTTAPRSTVVRMSLVCALVLGAAPAARSLEGGGRKAKEESASARSFRPRATPVRIVNEARSPVPVLNVGPVEIVGPMFSPREILVRSVDLAADGPNGTTVSLPAVQDWLIMEVDLLPLPPNDAQTKPAQACVASVQVPLDEVNAASNLPSFLSVSWSGLDYRSFHRPLPIALKRQVGETIELLLQAVAGDGSVRGPCRASVILRGVAL